MSVRYTPRSRGDLSAILEYVERESPRGARSVKKAIKGTIELIGQFPEGGRLAGVEAVRVLPAGRHPYLVYWSVEGGDAWIIHIRHSGRSRWEGER